MKPAAMIGVLLLSCACLASCGGGGSSSSSSTSATSAGVPSGAPQAQESIMAFADRYQSLVDAGSCAKLAAANKLLGAQGVPPCAQQMQLLHGFKVTGADSFGTGGVIDFTDSANPAGTFVVAVGADGQWKVLFNPAGANSVGSKARSAAPFTGAATAFLHAVQTKDCAGIYKNALSPQGEPQSQFCKVVLGSPQASTVATATPVPLGGTKNFQFYALGEDGHYATLAVGRNRRAGAATKYLVLGSVAGS